MRYEKHGRYWRVLDATGALVCITLYKKGAAEVVRRLEVAEAVAAEQDFPATDGAGGPIPYAGVIVPPGLLLDALKLVPRKGRIPIAQYIRLTYKPGVPTPGRPEDCKPLGTVVASVLTNGHCTVLQAEEVAAPERIWWAHDAAPVVIRDAENNVALIMPFKD